MTPLLRPHVRSKSNVAPTPPVDQTVMKFPSVSTMASPYETPAPQSARTSLTPSGSPRTSHPTSSGVTSLPVLSLGLPLGLSFRSQPSAGRKNRSLLSTITPASHSTTEPPAEQPQPLVLPESRYPILLSFLRQGAARLVISRRADKRQCPRPRWLTATRPVPPTLAANREHQAHQINSLTTKFGQNHPD